MYYYQSSKNQFSQHALKKYAKAFLQSSQIATLVTKKVIITSAELLDIKWQNKSNYKTELTQFRSQKEMNELHLFIR